DAGALEPFVAAVKRQIGAPHAELNADSSPARLDAGISAVLASLGASHTGRFKPDQIAYFEIADIFRGAIRGDLKRRFPPAGEVSYAGIGMIAEPRNGSLFVTDVYDGGPAARAGILVGDEVLDVDGTPYQEIGSFAGKVGRKVAVRLRRQAGGEPFVVNVRVE